MDFVIKNLKFFFFCSKLGLVAFLNIGITGFEVRPLGFEVRLIDFDMGSVEFEVRPVGFEAVRSSLYLGSTQHY